ncbi:MAG: PEGA domain-containing protein [Balneolaceae bacterium]
MLLILISITATVEIRAQDDISTLRVVGEPKIADGEFIADRADNRDVNGVLTAGLRINSDLTGFTFESNNGILKSQQLPGASLLYLSPNERVVEIYREGFTPFQLVLASYDINLESSKVWEVQITGNRKLNDAPARINISPENATIFVDGEENIVSGTYLDLRLAEGQHVIQIQKNQYRIVEDTVTVSSTTVNNFNYTLEEIDPIFLRLDSEPSGAAVYLDDDPGSKGRTPIQIPVYPGPHAIRLELDGYVTQTDELQINNNTDALAYNLQEYAGYLTVNTIPANAGLLVDGQVRAERDKIKLTPGLHQLEVTASGFDSQKKNIEIVLGDTLTENINLGMITGDLVFSVMQPDADVVLKQNGQTVEQWQGSKRVADLPVGNYTIEASLKNFRTETGDFELTRDESETLNFNLVQVEGIGTYSISSIFEDAEVRIAGTRYNSTFEKLPVEIESLPFGTYNITVSKPGFKTHREELTFNTFSGSMVLVDEFEPKTKGKAFFRSLFIPGTGHGYLGKGGRGFLYFLGSAAAIGYSVKSYLEYQENYDLYITDRERYLSASSNFVSLRDTYATSYENAQVSKDNLVLGLTVLAAIKGLETFDLLLQKSNRKILKNAKLRFNPANSGISMNINF